MQDKRDLITFKSAGALTTGVGKDRVAFPFNGEIVNAVATVGTAPTGAGIVLDLRINGVSIFTTTANRPTIPAAATKSPLSARPDVAKFVAGDVLDLQIVSVGSTVAGSDLDVAVQYTVR